MSTDESRAGLQPGYHREWLPDENWRVGTKYTKCRQPRCPNPPVAEFDRYSYALRKNRPYAYCEQHLYGRRLVNGQVLSYRVVEDVAQPAAKEE